MRSGSFHLGFQCISACTGLNMRVGYHSIGSIAIMHTGIWCIATRVQLLHAIHGQTAHLPAAYQVEVVLG